MKTKVQKIITFFLIILLTGCSASKTAIDSKQPQPIVRNDLASVRHRIEQADTIGAVDVVSLLADYRRLDTLQQEYINYLEENRKEILQQTEWIGWLQDDDTTVFFRQWGEYDIPDFLRNQVLLYSSIYEIRQCVEAMDDSIALAHQQNPRVTKEVDLKLIITAKIDQQKESAEELLKQVVMINPKEKLSEKQYFFYRAIADRYNDIVRKYYD